MPNTGKRSLNVQKPNLEGHINFSMSQYIAEYSKIHTRLSKINELIREVQEDMDKIEEYRIRTQMQSYQAELQYRQYPNSGQNL
jgi:hypothetical protein